MIEVWNREAMRQHLTFRGNVGIITIMNSRARWKSRALIHNNVSRGEISGQLMKMLTTTIKIDPERVHRRLIAKGKYHNFSPLSKPEPVFRALD